MKTIDQINEDISNVIERKRNLLRDTPAWKMLDLEDPIVQMTWTEIEKKTLVSKKFRELYEIVGDIEDYFRCLDANETKDCQNIRRNIEEKINSI